MRNFLSSVKFNESEKEERRKKRSKVGGGIMKARLKGKFVDERNANMFTFV